MIIINKGRKYDFSAFIILYYEAYKCLIFINFMTKYRYVIGENDNDRFK